MRNTISILLKPGTSPQNRGALRDYITLTKPLIVALQLTTTLTAMILATDGWPRGESVLWTLLGGALTAGGASALNQVIDRDTDKLMARTAHRPLPQGRMDASRTLLFGMILSLLGPMLLATFVNILSAALALVGVVYYVVLYSLILKPTSPQNIVIGGGAGAIPPLVGWAAVTGELSVAAFFLCAVVFFWTPSHFWALAMIRKRDYQRAGIPMFPIAYGEEATRWQIMLYAIQVVALTLLLPVVQLGSWLYFVSAFVLGSGLIYHAWQVLRHGDRNVTWRLYRYSNRYLALVFAALILDTLL
jgi:protoheme IX farnesyltransferase